MNPSFIAADSWNAIPSKETLIRIGNKDHVGYLVIPVSGMPEIVVMESGDRSQSGGANPWQKAWRRMKPLGYDVEYDEPLQAK